MKTKTMCTLAILSALYVIFGAFLKINLVAHVWLDLGYIIFAIALLEYGVTGTVVGALGCVIESMLFSGFGISYTWLIANLAIGAGCGFFYKKFDKAWAQILVTIVFVAIGMIGLKTPLECMMYNLPWATKIVSGLGAFAADTIAMVIGVVLYHPRFKVLIEKIR